MGSLDKIQFNWEGLARTDPFWAICSDNARRGGKWDPEVFFATGVKEISTVFSYLGSRGVHPDPNGEALDFGCGVGRLTQALAERFARCHGVDISETMVKSARQLKRRDADYHLNTKDDLSLFPDQKFSFIYSSIVLQHIPPAVVEKYLREFLRILKPGGILVFQLPDRFLAPEQVEPPPQSHGLVERLRSVFRVRSRFRYLLQVLGLKKAVPSYHMEMNGIPEQRVRELIATSSGKVLDVQITNSTLPDFNGDLQFLPSAPTSGWISRQYCVTRL